jgi:hypothetical protein
MDKNDDLSAIHGSFLRLLKKRYTKHTNYTKVLISTSEQVKALDW